MAFGRKAKQHRLLGFLHYWICVWQETAIRTLNFFTGLDLSKSQADSLLNQLADDWQQQHDAIAEPIALQMIVHRRNRLESRPTTLRYMGLFDGPARVVPLRSFVKEDGSDECPGRCLRRHHRDSFGKSSKSPSGSQYL